MGRSGRVSLDVKVSAPDIGFRHVDKSEPAILARNMSGRNAPDWLRWKDCPRCGKLEDTMQGVYLCQVCGRCQDCCGCSSDTDPKHTLAG